MPLLKCRQNIICNRFITIIAAVLTTIMALTSLACAQIVLTNVSYDPTREFYHEYNRAFEAFWKQQSDQEVRVRTTHGGSGSQARTVIDGLEADIVTLALEADINAIANRSKLIRDDWRGTFPNNNAPYTSTIVFLVRKDNPKNIQDWDDLVRNDVEVITPNPKSSGGARWNVMAAWAWAAHHYQGDEEQMIAFLTRMFGNVPVLDSGARGATITFIRRGVGDVLLAWENEAFLALEEMGQEAFDIVVPSISILAEPPVALVDQIVEKHQTRELATAYLNYLYSQQGQTLAAKHFFRPFDAQLVEPQFMERFQKLDLVRIDDFGGWIDVQKKFFSDGGIFDQIYDNAW